MGRGRPNSIDMLPEEADEDVRWAIEELNKRKRTAEDIRLELNERLLGVGATPISKSSFNRYSIFLARHGRAMREVRNVAALIAEKMDEEPEGDVGLLLGETIKTMIYDVMMGEALNEDGPSMKMLLAAAEAVRALELARSTNLKAAKFKRENFIKEAAEIAEKVAKEAGISSDRAAQIRRDILGVRS